MRKLFLLLILSFFSAQSFAGSCPDGSEPTKTVSADGSYYEFKCDADSKQSNNSTAGILKHTTIRLFDYICSLNREAICIDDVRSVLTNKYKFNIMYTDTDTWLTTDKDFTPPETVSSTQATELFEGL